jgi:hypothetical protein
MSSKLDPIAATLTQVQSNPIDHPELYVPHVVFFPLFLWLHMYTFDY